MSLELENTGRYELKYALPVSDRDEVLRVALDHVKPDPNADPLPEGATGYYVHSLYFDTPDLRDYFERLDSFRVRNRLRARTYGQLGDDRPVFLENKRKLDSRVVKHRVNICSAPQWMATGGDAPWRPWIDRLEGRRRYAAGVFTALVERGGRVPVSCVHYRREVYISKRSGRDKIRLTLDRDINATVRPDVHDLYGASDVDLLPPDWMVMELKFNRDQPGWMRSIVRALGLRAVPISKFGLSVMRGLRADRPAEDRFFTPRPLKPRRVRARGSR